jgi:hypothetical protein
MTDDKRHPDNLVGLSTTHSATVIRSEALDYYDGQE